MDSNNGTSFRVVNFEEFTEDFDTRARNEVSQEGYKFFDVIIEKALEQREGAFEVVMTRDMTINNKMYTFHFTTEKVDEEVDLEISYIGYDVE